MEKLFVKNFGPINDVDIELSQYTIFIGDTSTGKSTLAKLIAIFREFDFIANASYELFEKKLKEYGISFMDKESVVVYQNKGYFWRISFKDKKVDTNFEFQEIFDGNLTRGYNSIFTTEKVPDNHDFLFIKLRMFIEREKLKNLDNDLINNINSIIHQTESSEKYHKETLLSRALLLLYKHMEKEMEFQSSIYFPTERNIVSIVSDSLGGLYANNVALPDSFKKFFSLFEVSRKEIGKHLDIKDFNVLYTYKDGNNLISSNDYEISLDVASSGLQSIIPLYLVIENITQDKNPFKNNLIIEEPELNLHPIKQKVLTEYVVSKINKTGNKLVITTHSPYLLTVFDNLLLAKNVSNSKPDKNKSAKNIIPEKYWIDYKNISVYQIKNDGTIESIKNDKLKCIDPNVIDQVSENISDEFDKLTDLLYVED